MFYNDVTNCNIKSTKFQYFQAGNLSDGEEDGSDKKDNKGCILGVAGGKTI